MDFAQSLRLILPEEILSIGGLVLLLAAAWMGDRASRAISIASVALLVAAAAFAVPALSGDSWTSKILGFFALILASVNIFGGFLVTARMLAMYKKKGAK